ncbi:DUF4184 family protein [Chitinophaga vietnamensis]|uniref:DUF4184 family protein n=1 Tax=Chitinophaga vietnamensis TaxID=2593957 RepID=UPI001177BB88|nr:DUF4184 family protein [Chitinophaga vietnamensis]
MPFTVSHAALVVPFTWLPRRYLSATGLIIGSMVPDFLYFISLDPYLSAGHRLPGIFIYDIPLALLFAFLYHGLLRQTLIRWAPQWAAARLSRFGSFNWPKYFSQHYIAVIFSILLGVYSHLFLDAFTHGHGYFVQHLPALQAAVDLPGKTMPGWYLMQFITSILGLIVLFYFFFRIPVRKRGGITFTHKLFFWLLTGALASIILLVNERYHHIDCKGLDYLAVVMGGVMYAFVVMAVAFNKRSVGVLSR